MTEAFGGGPEPEPASDAPETGTFLMAFATLSVVLALHTARKRLTCR